MLAAGGGEVWQLRPHSKLVHTGYLIVWDVQTAGVKWRREHDVESLVFSPNAQILASHNRKHADLWDVQTGRLLRTLTRSWYQVDSIAFSLDAKVLATGGWIDEHGLIYGEVNLWDAQSGTLLRTLRSERNPVTPVAFSPDGRFVASGHQDGIVKLWDVRVGKFQQTSTENKSRVDSLTFSPDGRMVASGYGNGKVVMWLVK
jgi:WD40 repeat protein